MSLSRSTKLRWAADVDPHAMTDSEDEKTKKEAEKAKRKAAARRRAAQAQRQKAAPAAGGVAPPRLRTGPEGVEVVEETRLLRIAEEENVAYSVLRVNGNRAGFSVEGDNKLFTRQSEVTQRRVAEDWGFRTQGMTHKPLVRYASFGELEFEATPQLESCCLLQNTSDTQNLNGRAVAVAALRQVDCLYSMRPYVDDAAQHLTVEDVQRALTRQYATSRQPVNLTKALSKSKLTASEMREFEKFCKSNRYDTIDSEQFADGWSVAKNSSNQKYQYDLKETVIAPEDTLVASIFGSSKAPRPVQEVLLLIRQMGFVEGMHIAPTSIEEMEARQYGRQDRAERDEEGFTEDVEGGERVFDDDVEDQPEMDPDHADMDKDTKTWVAAEDLGLNELPSDDEADGDDEANDAGGDAAGSMGPPAAKKAKAASKKRSSASAESSASKRKRA